MKEVPLTQGKVALVDDEDYENVIQHKWSVLNKNERHTSYAIMNVVNAEGNSSTRSMHRFLMNPPKGRYIDHIDGNGLNNQKANLRVCAQRDNVKNAKKHAASVSQYKGVSPVFTVLKWKAQIQIDEKKIFLGAFDSEAEAARAYNEAAIKYFGAFAKLNILPEE
jgi:hypothetical protein